MTRRRSTTFLVPAISVALLLGAGCKGDAPSDAAEPAANGETPTSTKAAGDGAADAVASDAEGSSSAEEEEFGSPPGGGLTSAPPRPTSANEEAVEGFYRDDHGAVPIKWDFDADPGELCGNGKSFYWTSKPPKKPIPRGWKPPPPSGTEGYEGPDKFEEIKESPYAMPSSKAVLARRPIQDNHEKRFAQFATLELAGKGATVGLVSRREPRFDILKAVFEKATRVDPSELETRDEAALAKALADKNIRYLVVDRTSPPVKAWAEDAYASVRIRMRDGLPLRHFRLMAIGSGYSVFERAEPGGLTEAQQQALTDYARAGLTSQTGSFPEVPDLRPASPGKHRVVVSLRSRAEAGLKGRKIARALGRAKTPKGAFDEAIRKLRNGWLASVGATLKLYGVKLSPELPRAMERIEIEVDVMQDLAYVTDVRMAHLLWYFETGVHGMAVEMKKRFHYLEPTYALYRERKAPQPFLEKLLVRNRKHLGAFVKKHSGKYVVDRRLWETEPGFWLRRFRTLHWVESPKREAIPLYRGVPFVPITAVTRDALVSSLQVGAEWLVRNQTPNGQYAYKYEPMNKAGRRWYPGGNILRHALNPYTLLLVNAIAPDERLLASARKGIDFTLEFLRKRDKRCVICHRDPPARYYNAKLGANAVTMLSILELAKSGNIDQYRPALDCLAEEILYLQDPNGHFRQYDVPTDHPYYGAENTIAPGEIILALARMHAYTKDPRYLAAARLSIPYYIEQWRFRVKRQTARGIYNEEDRMNIIGIIPWMVMAYNDLHRETGEAAFAEEAMELQGWVDDYLFYGPERSAYPDYPGAGFKTHTEAPAINACQFIEGAASALAIAKRTGKDVEKRRDVVLLGARFCLQLQYDSWANTFFTPIPEEVMGGYRYHLLEMRLRNDYSYHAISAIAQSVSYLAAEDYAATRALQAAQPLGLKPDPKLRWY